MGKEKKPYKKFISALDSVWKTMEISEKRKVYK